jgi:DNA-binding IclR family transcriptional regulator
VTNAEHNGAGTLSRAVRVLEYFADNGMQSSMREVAEALDLPRSTVHRTCQALVREGLLDYDARARRYAWGGVLTRIARSAVQPVEVRRLAPPIMEELVEAFDESALLVIYDASRRVVEFADQVQCKQPLVYRSALNVPMPAHAGASGLAVLAFLPEDEIEAIIAAGLDPITPDTITEPDRLREELARVRARGYALTRGERTPGAVGIAAPVYDAVPHVIGALMVTVPEYRSERQLEERIAERVREDAARLSRLLGG